MKTLKESIFDEKDNLKNIDTNTIFNLIQKYRKTQTGVPKKLHDNLNRPINLGDLILYSNGIGIYVGLVINLDEDTNEVFMSWNKEKNGWWVHADRCLKINKNALNEIIKIK